MAHLADRGVTVDALATAARAAPADLVVEQGAQHTVASLSTAASVIVTPSSTVRTSYIICPPEPVSAQRHDQINQFAAGLT